MNFTHILRNTSNTSAVSSPRVYFVAILDSSTNVQIETIVKMLLFLARYVRTPFVAQTAFCKTRVVSFESNFEVLACHAATRFK